MALVVAVEAAGVGIVGFAAGGLVGRLGLRRTMLVADACRAPLVAAIPVAIRRRPPHVSPPAPARLCHRRIRNALVRLEGLRVARDRRRGRRRAGGGQRPAPGGDAHALVLGPVLAGVLIGLVGATTVLYIDAATFAVGFAARRSVRRRGRSPRPRSPRGLGAGVRSCSRTGSYARGRSRWWPATSRGWRSSSRCPFLVLTRFGERPEDPRLAPRRWGAGAVVGSALDVSGRAAG